MNRLITKLFDFKKNNCLGNDKIGDIFSSNKKTISKYLDETLQPSESFLGRLSYMFETDQGRELLEERLLHACQHGSSAYKKHRGLSIEKYSRKCLKCEKEFTTHNKFNRLCVTCRKRNSEED